MVFLVALDKDLLFGVYWLLFLRHQKASYTVILPLERSPYQMLKISLLLHVVAAIFWIGGMLFLSLIIVPFLNQLKDPQEKRNVYRAIGPRYRAFAWLAIVILVITGPLNMYLLGISPANIFDPSFHGTSYGQPLMIKLALVLLIIVSSLLHDFWVGPNARSSTKFSLYAKIFGRGNLIIALLIVIFAVIIRTGGW